jgi:HPt (histidine-containing phosphotransfer) domain-containing protein
MGGALPDPLPVLDPQPLQDLLEMGAEPGLVRELVGLLEVDAPARLTALRKALADEDKGVASPEAHQLKGALGTLGLMRFADLTRQLEEYLQEGRWNEARSLLETFPTAYEEALAALRSAFPES